MADISPEQRKIIEQQAKRILDQFSNSLSSVALEQKTIKKSLGGFREEGTSTALLKGFREGMLANAPKKDKSFVYAESKTW